MCATVIVSGLYDKFELCLFVVLSMLEASHVRLSKPSLFLGTFNFLRLSSPSLQSLRVGRVNVVVEVDH